ncbi:MAG: hypothetical protein KDJ38_12545 [Gammaproteobacteria bacterium]|nr:hypothetical protein [Gammaproteobacteria bacterium]
MLTTDSVRISPVLQFLLLLVPVVFSSFLLIFAAVGLLVEGRDKIQWSVEAWGVSLLTGAVIIGYSALVLLLVKLRGGDFRHVLALSSFFHIGLTLLLVALVAVIL